MNQHSLTLRLAQRSILVASTVLFALPSHAQWLTHTGGGNAATGVFSGVGGAYSGTVTTRMTVLNDGGNDGVPGLSPFSTSTLTGAFQANYPTNSPNGTFNALSLTYNHTRDVYIVEMDFSGLQNGYLPTGTIFAIADLDIWEDWTQLTAFDTTGAKIPPIWLTPRTGQAAFLDFDNSDGYQGNLTPPTMFQDFVFRRYGFVGIDHNETSGLLGFTTAFDIKSIQFVVSKHVAGDFEHLGGSALGIAAVPEPASLVALVVGLAGMAARRRNR